MNITSGFDAVTSEFAQDGRVLPELICIQGESSYAVGIRKDVMTGFDLGPYLGPCRKCGTPISQGYDLCTACAAEGAP